MPMLIRAAGHQQLFDATVVGWERALFAGQPAAEWAAHWPSRALSEALHLAYLSYYPIIFSVPVALYLTSRRAEFSEATFVLMFTFVLCFLSYIVFPVAGPRYLQTPDAPEGPVRSTVVWLLETRSSRGTAFPSSHVAVALTQSILAIRYFSAKGLVVALFSVGLMVGAVYGGFHYAVDVLAGVVLGLVTCSIALAFSARTTAVTAQAKATAPT
jgi:membrane-associated phospholipid phosphatase